MEARLSLHPDFPVVEGLYRLTRDWELDLPAKFNRRIEDGDMVIWQPGLTFCIAVWGSEPDLTPDGILAWILEDASPERTDEKVDRSGDVIRLTYRLREQDPQRDPQAYVSINGYVIAPSGHVQITAYCDSSEAESTGAKVIGSVRLSRDDT
jgi:hypothetical protein